MNYNRNYNSFIHTLFSVKYEKLCFISNSILILFLTLFPLNNFEIVAGKMLFLTS